MAAPAQATRADPHGSRTMTLTPTTDAEAGPSTASASPPETSREGTPSSVGVLRLRGGPTVRRPRVNWSAETIDNEGMGRKKSKSECGAVRVLSTQASVADTLGYFQSAASTTSHGVSTSPPPSPSPLTTMTAVGTTRTAPLRVGERGRHAARSAAAGRSRRTAAPSRTVEAVMGAHGGSHTITERGMGSLTWFYSPARPSRKKKAHHGHSHAHDSKANKYDKKGKDQA